MLKIELRVIYYDMKSKFKVFLADLFLVVGSLIGMGFATGKEVRVFFGQNKGLAVFSILIFLLGFYLLFNLISNYKLKHNIADFKDFNKSLFGEYHKSVDLILIIVYIINSASMLAGFDYILFETIGVYFSFSILLTLVTFFVIKKGVEGVRTTAYKLVPVLLLLVFLNLFVNGFYITNGFSNFSFLFNFKNLNVGNVVSSVLLPILFLGANFLLAIFAILSVRGKHKILNITSILIFAILLMLGVLVVFNKSESLLPFLSSSKNLSYVFYLLYFCAIIIALFTSLILSTQNAFSLFKVRSNFDLIVLLLLNQMVSFLGLEFIIKYLYTFSGLLGIIYILFIVFKILIKNKNNYKK